MERPLVKVLGTPLDTPHNPYPLVILRTSTSERLPTFDVPPEYPLVDWWCRDDQDYDRALRAVWDMRADLLIHEHDIQADYADYDNMFGCRQPLCAARYYVYPPSTGLADTIPVHRFYEDGTWTPVNPDDKYADAVGLGFTKLSYLARRAMGFPTQGGNWRDLDVRVSNQAMRAGLRWHLHREVTHHHTEPHTRTGPGGQPTDTGDAGMGPTDSGGGSLPILADEPPDPLEGLTYQESVDRAQSLAAPPWEDTAEPV